MFSFFRKKEFLIDLLPGVIDIHNHLLPGIDDGAANVQDSLEMIFQLKELGITDFIATPHIMNDFYPNTTVTINNALETLKIELQKVGTLKDLKFSFAAEYMMDQNFMDTMSNGPLLTLKDKFVLVEMSYFQAPINLNEILFQLQTQGYKPILAHPERYAYCHSKDLKKYEDLKNRGCYFQLNTLSLSDHYGKNMHLAANELLVKGMIDFLGSDIHRTQHITKMKSIKISRSQTELIKRVINKTGDYFK